MHRALFLREEWTERARICTIRLKAMVRDRHVILVRRSGQNLARFWQGDISSSR